MLGAVIVIAQHRLDLLQRHLLLGGEGDRELATGIHRLLERGVEHLLDSPDSRIVIGAVPLVIAGIGFREVENPILLRMVEPLLGGKLNQILRSHHVGTGWIVLLQAALIAGSEIVIFRQTLRHPVMAGGSLQIPELVIIHHGDTKSLSRAYGLDDVAKQGDRLVGRCGPGEQHIGNVILGDPLIFHIGVKGERFG